MNVSVVPSGSQGSAASTLPIPSCQGLAGVADTDCGAVDFSTTKGRDCSATELLCVAHTPRKRQEKEHIFARCLG